MTVPTVYKWDDMDAPVLSGTIGALSNLLTKCLVDGYGVKAGAGWTKEFTNLDNTIVALRNNPVSGTGFFLQITDTSTLTSGMQGYETMAVLDSGDGPFLETSGSWEKSKAATSEGRCWLVVATDTFFHFVVYYDATPATGIICAPDTTNVSGFAWGFFGDFAKSGPDGFGCIIGHGASRNSHIDHKGGVLYDASFPDIDMGDPAHGIQVGIPRPLDGTPATPTLVLLTRPGGPVGYLTAVSFQNWTQLGTLYTGEALTVARRFIVETSSSTYRGWLPGHFVPCNSYDGFAQLALETITHDGRTFVCVPHRSVYAVNPDSPSFNGEGVFLIEVGGEWT